MNKIVKILKNSEIIKNFNKGKNLVVNGNNEEALIIASAFLESKETLIIIKNSLYEANQLYEYLSYILGKEVLLFPVDESYRIESLAASPELLEERLVTLFQLTQNKPHIVIAHPQSIMRYIPSKNLFTNSIINIKVGDIIDPYVLQKRLLDSGYKRTNRVDEPLYFSKRGGIIDVYSIQEEYPIRIEFFDDEIDSLRYFDPITQGSTDILDEITIIPASDILYDDQELPRVKQEVSDLENKTLKDLDELSSQMLQDKLAIDMDNFDNHDTSTLMYAYYSLFLDTANLLTYVDKYRLIISNSDEISVQVKNFIAENFYYNQELLVMGKALKGLDYYQDYQEIISRNTFQEFNQFSKGIEDINFHTRDIHIPLNDEKGLINNLKDYLKQGSVLISLEDQHQITLMVDLFDRYELKYTITSLTDKIYPGINIELAKIPKGIELVSQKIAIITANELFPHRNLHKIKYTKYKDAKVIRDYQELNPGDYVVHDQHGIGQYVGIKTLELKGNHRDYLHVAYKGNDILYIPIEQFKLIRKYSSANGIIPKVNKLGDGKWGKEKAKARAKVDDIAQDLINLYSKRMQAKGYQYPSDDKLQKEFEADFGFELTPDQEKSVREIKADMEKSQPMDRLLCGDVGFGKTEVAMIVAFKAITANKQVALMCPTTILSQQHYKTACERFKSFPVEIALINRFVSPKKVKEIIKRLKAGEIDLIIGTHRLLSNDVEFNDLGLLIVDEEQRFGVKQKEKIKEIRETIDVLSMTATPIPRTLQISLMGIRGLSQIETPPINRLPVQTYVIEKNNSLVKQVIERELARNGQVFYLHNKTENISNVAYNLNLMVPGAKVAIGHGQMDKKELEDVMQDFIDKKTNLLVCTTIIETGIDIPNANTIIIDQADHFGLSQLYQIRGRVGRSDKAAYAYLLYNPKKQMTPEASKRLKAIKEFTELGSGYKLALRDLAIRGSGDILGGKQAGFIDSVGFDMYMQILQEAIDEKMGKESIKPKEIDNIQVDVDGYIPGDYVDSDLEKLELYQNLNKTQNLEEVEELVLKFKDYYGKLPDEIKRLISKRKLEIIADDCGVDKVEDSSDYVTLIYSLEVSHTLRGDKLFTRSNQLFTKPKFKSLGKQIAISLPKEKNWINKACQLLLDMKNQL